MIGTGSIRFINAKIVNVNGKIYGEISPIGTNGDDNIVNLASKVTVSAFEENDSVSNSGSEFFIKVSDGNDRIFNYDQNATIDGGTGNDSVYNREGSNNVSISGGAGNDAIRSFGSDGVTINGEAGNDTFIYANSDGKDTVTGFETGDLLQITGAFSGTYNSSKKEIYFKVGSTANAITLKNFTATTFNINGANYGINGTKLVKK